MLPHLAEHQPGLCYVVKRPPIMQVQQIQHRLDIHSADLVIIMPHDHATSRDSVIGHPTVMCHRAATMITIDECEVEWLQVTRVEVERSTRSHDQLKARIV